MHRYRWLLALAVPLLFSGSHAAAQVANPPTNVIPTFTIDTTDVNNHVISGVSVRWSAGAPADDGWLVSGYNVFRAPSADGPWTKVNDLPVPATPPVGFVDAAPANPASTFYAVTAIETDEFANRESERSAPAQAANNLVYNSSFERSWDAITPIGWVYGQWGGDGTGAMTADEKVDGDKGLFLKTGATARGAQFFNTDESFQPPTSQGVPYVLGLYGRFEDTQTTWPLALRQAYGGENATWNGRPTVIDWYPTNAGGTLSDWDSAGLTANGDTPWTWLGNTAGAIPHENSSTTRLGVFWANDGLTTLGVSTAFADDARFQRKTVGATGDVWGLIQQSGANPVSARVSAGGKTVWTDPYRGRFVLRDMPTGPVEITISAGGEADRVITVPNYGGFVYFGHESNGYITLWDASGLPLKLTGKVTLPDGSPAVDASVFLKNPDFGTIVVITDENGDYVIEDIGSWNFSDVTVTLPPYTKVTENRAFGLNGIAVRNYRLLPAPPTIEIGKTATPPVLDGVVNAAEWAASLAIPVDKRTGGAQPTVQTTAYAMWDNANLYLAFVAEEPNPAGIEARATGHDNTLIWSHDGATFNADDNLGVWLDPVMADVPGPGSEQWQLITNTNQTNPSWADIAWQGTPGWNLPANITGFEFKARVDADNKVWFTEMKIPFSGLGLGAFGGMPAPTVSAGTEWLMQLQRARHQTPPDGEGLGTGWFRGRFVNALAPSPKGDLNGDRQVTPADAMVAMKIVGGVEALGARLPQGDINGDNSVTMIDAARILRKTQGLDNF